MSRILDVEGLTGVDLILCRMVRGWCLKSLLRILNDTTEGEGPEWRGRSRLVPHFVGDGRPMLELLAWQGDGVPAEIHITPESANAFLALGMEELEADNVDWLVGVALLDHMISMKRSARAASADPADQFIEAVLQDGERIAREIAATLAEKMQAMAARQTTRVVPPDIQQTTRVVPPSATPPVAAEPSNPPSNPPAPPAIS